MTEIWGILNSAGRSVKATPLNNGGRRNALFEHKTLNNEAPDPNLKNVKAQKVFNSPRTHVCEFEPRYLHFSSSYAAFLKREHRGGQFNTVKTQKVE